MGNPCNIRHPLNPNNDNNNNNNLDLVRRLLPWGSSMPPRSMHFNSTPQDNMNPKEKLEPLFLVTVQHVNTNFYCKNQKKRKKTLFDFYYFKFSIYSSSQWLWKFL